MVKLIVTDVDGTLVPEGTDAFPARLLELIPRLRARGVAFATASGRSYSSLRRLFAPVAADMMFLSENGSMLYDGQGRLLWGEPVSRAAVEALFACCAAHPDAEIQLGAASTCYLSPKSDDFLHMIRDVQGTHVTPVSRVEEVTEPVYKMSAYCPRGTAEFANFLAARWAPDCRVFPSSQHWMDFSQGDKCAGLQVLMERLGVTAEETMYFGDGYNDADCLTLVGHPWLKSDAAEPLRRRFPRQTASVVDTLEAFLTSLTL